MFVFKVLAGHSVLIIRMYVSHEDEGELGNCGVSPAASRDQDN